MISNAWTYGRTKCPSLLMYSQDLVATWTLTWTKCPSSRYRQNLAYLDRYALRYIDINIDMVSMLIGRIALKSPNIDIHMDIMSMIKSHAWTNAWTQCPCSK